MNKQEIGYIFYDGLCLLCSREIDHYRKQIGSERFQFIDITAPDFSASEHGVDPFEVHKVMHVKDPNGVLHQGIEAFRAIWNELPRYRILYKMSSYTSVQWFLKRAYKIFTSLRPYLPKNKRDCSQSPYCDLK